MDHHLVDEWEIGRSVDERVYAWRILRAQTLCQVARPGRHPDGRESVMALIRQADDAGLGKIELIVELARMTATLMLRTREDPLDVLWQVEQEILTDRDANGEGSRSSRCELVIRSTDTDSPLPCTDTAPQP